MLERPTVFAASLPSKARPDANRILVPSGEKNGATLSAAMAMIWVSGVALEPSEFIDQMLAVVLVLALSLPSRARLDSNAIVPPSGEKTGTELLASCPLIRVKAAVLRPSEFVT
jgi:hypothetical protein